MRTTVDLPDDIHALARHIAHQQKRTMSEVLTDLIRRGLEPSQAKPQLPSGSGMPTVSVGRVITEEDVWSLEDEI